MSDRFNGYSRTVLSAALAASLAACANTSSTAPDKGSAAWPAANPASAPKPEAPVAPPPPPLTPVTQAQAQKLALAAATLLESGREEPARAELQKALVGDPNNRLALNLMTQITVDPMTVLGHESFNYTVRPNDTMSGIAGRFLGDIYSFYILARYNNIAVPRQVAGGQVLRIPGKAPPRDATSPRAEPPAVAPAAVAPTLALPPSPPAAPPPPPEPTAGERAMRTARASEKAGNLEQARTDYLAVTKLDQAGAQAKAEQLGKQLVQRYSLNARTAFAKQDLAGAIGAWDRVLVIDPANDTAKLERQRAQVLKNKAEKLGS